MYTGELLKTEMKRLQEVLSQCRHPKWAIDKILQQQDDREKEIEENKAATTPAKQEMSHSGNLFTRPV